VSDSDHEISFRLQRRLDDAELFAEIRFDTRTFVMTLLRDSSRSVGRDFGTSDRQCAADTEGWLANGTSFPPHSIWVDPG
jgi:hypothetical protein